MNRFAVLSASALLVLASFTSVGLADESSVATSELDTRIDKALFQAINSGVPLYNQGDPAGCYRLYQ